MRPRVFFESSQKDSPSRGTAAYNGRRVSTPHSYASSCSMTITQTILEVGARCRLTSASLLNLAEVAEEACGREIHIEADLDDIEAVPVEIWFDLGVADVDKDMLE